MNCEQSTDTSGERKAILAARIMTRSAAGNSEKRSGPPGANQARAASVAPGSYNAESRTFRVILSTGADVKRFGYVEQLSLDPAAVDLSRVALGQCKFLDSHAQGTVGAILGTLTNARLEGGALVGDVQLAESDAARAAEANIAAGHIRGVSIGYRVDVWTLVQTGDVETWRADKWTLLEASAVSVPADAGAMIRSAAEDNGTGERANRPALSSHDIRGLQRLAETAGGNARAKVDEWIDAGLSRTAIFEKLTRLVGERQADASSMIIPNRFASDPAIASETGRAFMHPNEETFDNPHFLSNVVGRAIYYQLSKKPPEGAARQFASVPFNQLPHAMAEARGERPSFLSGRLGDFFGRSMSTSDFPIALANAQGLYLRDLLQATASGAAMIAGTGTVDDFKEKTEVSISSYPELKKIEEGGEFTYGALDENGEKYRVYTFGRIVNFTEQALKNDGLGALERGTRELSFALQELKSSLILSAMAAVMSDGKALFHADHGNLAGSGSDVSVTSLSEGRLAIRMQKPLGGQSPLGLSPKFILVPAQLETTAQKAVADITPMTSDDVNPFAGKLQVAVEPRLAGKNWFLFADPAIYPCVKFVTLDGMPSPVFEMEREFNRLGVSFRVYWHVGAAPIDPRGCWKNPWT
jgi:hypothetical protein